MPGLFWVPIVDWEETAGITIEISVMSLPGTPTLHRVLLTADNSTVDTWDRFEIEVSGPATFSLPSVVAPVSISRFAEPPIVSETDIRFQGIDGWDRGDFPPTITFGLDVTPPVASESVLLTLRPIAQVPEPSSGALLTIAGLLAHYRRRRI